MFRILESHIKSARESPSGIQLIVNCQFKWWRIFCVVALITKRFVKYISAYPSYQKKNSQNISQNIFAPFNWKLLKLGSANVRDIRKNVLFLQVVGSTLAPPTPPVIRVVLLQTEGIIQRVFGLYCTYKHIGWSHLLRPI